jgi:hypothetical protein
MATEHSNPNDQESRIRAALGLAHGPLPKVRGEWLHRYYEYLAANLSLPFDAEYTGEISRYRQIASAITVVALIDPDGHARHEEFGLACRAHRGTQEIEVPLADVELKEHTPNYRLVEDYWYWFWNWRFDPQI